MDFIERWFELSPDGGDGSTELTYIVVAVAVVVAIVGWRTLKRLEGRRRG